MRDEARLGLGAALVALLMVSACAEQEADDADLAEDTAAMTPPTPQPLFSAPFQPDAGAAGAQISGNADVFRGRLGGGASGSDGFTLAVHLNGLTDGDHAWHIHSGPCGTEAPVVVPFTATPTEPGIDQPITVGQAGGMAMDTAFVPADRLTLDALQASPHSVHVHARGGVDHGPTVACADLRSAGTATGGSPTDSAAR